MRARRLRAPATDGGLLVDPPPGAVGELVAANTARLSEWDYDFQGRRASRLREQIRREVLGRAEEFLRSHGLDVPGSPREGAVAALTRSPLIVTGHQPELFHPGVWVKNFAAAALARSGGGVALNLIVDNDLPKAASIQVPAVSAAGDLVRTARIDFDRWPGEIPYEDWKVHDEPMFETFADRVRTVMAGTVPDPVLDEYWPRAVHYRAQTRSLGLALALARRELEQSWGVLNLEIPLSEVCRTDGFLWFAVHLLAQLPRYREVHNACLRQYRAAHRIRSRHHPVPPLARQDDWLEAPFWVWRASQPRRRALLARQRPRTLELRVAGDDAILLALPLKPDGEACCAVERLRELDRDSIRLRTRALTTTLFSRFLLGDLFIHGIGGAKYDELGDQIARRFLAFNPPEFLTVSLTFHVGVPTQPATPEDLASTARRLRDLEFNPDRFLSEPIPEDARILIRERSQAITRTVKTRSEGIARSKAIRHLNEALQPWLEPMRADLQARLAQLRADLGSNRVARNREFAFVLHSMRRLHQILIGMDDTFRAGDPSDHPRGA